MNSFTSIIIYSKAVKEVLNMTLLNFWAMPRLTEKQSAKCVILIPEDELICTLKNMPKNKWPVNDGLTKEFYDIFCDELTISLLVLENHFLKRS